tara:strand:+ start:14215 stop:14472 length:258 start_codon:yes stop_codon:yes gene_type:complete
MKSKGRRWRQRAYEYLKEHGSATSSMLLRNVKNRKGLTFYRGAPRNNAHVFQIMRGDKRFSRKKVMVKGTLSNYEVVEWGLVDEE